MRELRREEGFTAKEHDERLCDKQDSIAYTYISSVIKLEYIVRHISISNEGVSVLFLPCDAT